MEAALARFEAAHTQVLGVSIDSVHSHANWARSLGGVSFPLLSDFEPKGAMAKGYGAYLEGPGITDRATVLIDSAGVVQHASSVTPAGSRNIDELAKLCEDHHAKATSATSPFEAVSGVPADTTLFVKNNCGFSRSVLLTVENLHLGDAIRVRNVSEDPAAQKDFAALSDKNQAPCLVTGGDLLFESAEINKKLVGCAARL